MNSDFKDLLHIFAEEEVEFLVVGGYAVIHHTQPRYTKDLDVWIMNSAGRARPPILDCDNGGQGRRVHLPR